MKFEDTGLRDTPLLRRAFDVGYAPIKAAFAGRDRDFAAGEADKGFRAMTVNLALAADASSHPEHEEFAAAALAGHDAIRQMIEDDEINRLSSRVPEIAFNTSQHRDRLVELVERLEKRHDSESLRDGAKSLIEAQKHIETLNTDEKFMMRLSLATILGNMADATDEEIVQLYGETGTMLDKLEILYEDLCDDLDAKLDQRFQDALDASRVKVTEAGLLPLSFEDAGLPDTPLIRKAFDAGYGLQRAQFHGTLLSESDVNVTVNTAYREGPLMIARVAQQYAPDDKRELYTATALMIESTVLPGGKEKQRELGAECAALLEKLGQMDEIEAALAGDLDPDELAKTMNADQRFFLRTALLGMVTHINTAPFDDLVAEADIAEDMLKALPSVFNAVADTPASSLDTAFAETLSEMTVRLRAASDASRYIERDVVELYPGGPAISPKGGPGGSFF